MSAVSVRCPGCNERLAVPGPAGAAVVCPRCGASVPASDEGNTVIDGEVPDFSYLRKQAERDADVLTAEESEDEVESALGENSARRPAAKPAPKPTAPAPAPVVYTPPPADTGNPFAAISDRSPKPRPGTKAKAESPAPPPVVRAPAWVWPVVVALAVYAFVASGVAAWGWLRPTATAPTTPAKVGR